uniref:F-box/LRR-repeat protein At1g67190-like n=1 Tax=Nicotiana tabacum TaxID=4097 RepID=A0A1S4CU79_TOBAC|nr:PREDICTED: F-box/LRR-repeat protein At1g67190-like [Nicotiana tabacum]
MNKARAFKDTGWKREQRSLFARYSHKIGMVLVVNLCLNSEVMEFFPVEVIGNILSRLEDARDVVIASFTCRKWQEAWRNHLHTLKFNSDDWPVYDERMTRRFEVIITQTIFQTNALQCLSITMKKDVLSAAPVIAWLLSLSLERVTISALDLSRLLTVCPKIEVLNLVCLDFDTFGPGGTMKFRSNSLKDIHIQGIVLDEIILEADSLEKLQIKDFDLGIFKLLSKGTLRLLEMDDVYGFPPDIGENAENLEIVEFSNSTTWQPDFHHMISKLSKVRRMSLCGITFEDDVEVEDNDYFCLLFSIKSFILDV